MFPACVLRGRGERGDSPPPPVRLRFRGSARGRVSSALLRTKQNTLEVRGRGAVIYRLWSGLFASVVVFFRPKYHGCLYWLAE